MHKAAWAEIHVESLIHNLHTIRSQLKPHTAVCAVLKADAYGHGDIGTAQSLSGMGLVDMMAVGKMSELIRLSRKLPDNSPDILLLGDSEAGEVLEHLRDGSLHPARVLFSVYSMRQARELDALGTALRVKLRVHIRTDGWNSGMGLGYEEFLAHEEELCASGSLEICGIYSHLYSAYSDNPGGILQELERFDRFIRRIRPDLRKRVKVHILNSALIFRFPGYAYDMVRAGTALYGLSCGDKGLLRPAMRICATVFDVRMIDASAPLSYHAGRPDSGMRKIARIMLGYWDSPLLLTQGDVQIRIRGRLFRLADEVCMDNLCIDVSDADDIAVGDTAVLLGEEGVTVNEILERNHISYVHSEWLCMTAGRLEKVYL